MKYGIFCFIALTVLLSACIGVSDGPTSELETQGDTITPPQKSMDGGKTMVEKASDTLSDIKAAMASGLGYKCVYSFEGTTAETMVMGENFRSKTKTEGFEINTLSDGIWIYTWIGGESTGTKFRVADFEGDETYEGEDTEYADLETISDAAENIQCSPAALTEGDFNPPASIKFTDYRAFLENMEKIGQGDSGDFCDMCEMIPAGADKDECLKSCKSMG